MGEIGLAGEVLIGDGDARPQEDALAAARWYELGRSPDHEALRLLLLEIERLAILANNRAVPRQTQVYMFGSYAQRILDLMTDKERASMSWELAVGYLDGVAKDTEQYAKLTRSERTRFWR